MQPISLPTDVSPRMMQIAGTPTAVRRKGSGHPLLFLHGANFTGKWLPFHEEIAKGADLIAPDHIGFGATPFQEWLVGFDDLVLHYEELREDQGLEQFDLVGYALGGWIAAEYATFYPERVRRLVLISSAGLAFQTKMTETTFSATTIEEQRESFKLQREFTYDTEGWGLAYDGTNLILSDGSSTLTFLDPQTHQPVRKLHVTMNGRPITELNELEFIEGEIWANVWQKDLILIIDPATGQVKSFLNLKGILAPSDRKGSEDVLNGIAYDAEHKRIFVTGKLWPRLFEIKVKP